MPTSKTVLLINCYHLEADEKILRYHEWIAAAARESGWELAVTETTDRRNLPPEHFDFAIVSGSWKMVGEGDVEERLLRFVRRRRKPLLGVCYGHQALAHAFGARVVKDCVKHEGQEKIELRVPGELFAGFPPQFEMRESHEETVARDEALESSFAVTATGPGGTVESISHRLRPLFGVQFHPEESGAIGRQLLLNFLKAGSRT